MTSIDSAIASAGFTAFARLLGASPFGALLESGDPFTIFAPTDASFDKFSNPSLDHLMEGDGALLQAVASYHFAAGKVMSQQFAGKRIRARTHGGQTLVIDGKSGLRVNSANVVMPDVVIGATVLHGIDAVLWPREPLAAAL